MSTMYDKDAALDALAVLRAFRLRRTEDLRTLIDTGQSGRIFAQLVLLTNALLDEYVAICDEVGIGKGDVLAILDAMTQDMAYGNGGEK